MSRKLSHQAEVENRHMSRGSWFPEEDHDGYIHSGNDFDYTPHIYTGRQAPKASISKAKSESIRILTKQWGFEFTDALSITVEIFKQVDVADEYLEKAIHCYVIMGKLNPKSMSSNIKKLKEILTSDKPKYLLSEIIKKYEQLG